MVATLGIVSACAADCPCEGEEASTQCQAGQTGDGAGGDKAAGQGGASTVGGNGSVHGGTTSEDAGAANGGSDGGTTSEAAGAANGGSDGGGSSETGGASTAEGGSTVGQSGGGTGGRATGGYTGGEIGGAGGGIVLGRGGAGGKPAGGTSGEAGTPSGSGGVPGFGGETGAEGGAAGESAAAGAGGGTSAMCGKGVYTGDVDASNISELIGYTEITGSLNVAQLTRVTELGCLTRIGGSLGSYVVLRPEPFSTWSNITTLAGLENVTHVEGDVDLSRLDELETLSGLSGLGSVGGSLIANDYFGPEDDFTGVENLATVGGDVTIEGMSYSSVSTLDGLSRLVTIGGALTSSAIQPCRKARFVRSTHSPRLPEPCRTGELLRRERS